MTDLIVAALGVLVLGSTLLRTHRTITRLRVQLSDAQALNDCLVGSLRMADDARRAAEEVLV